MPFFEFNVMGLNSNVMGKERKMTEENKTTVTTETPVTFDELLQDSDYQREFDKKVAKALETAKAKWEKQAEVERSEAEKLAKMTAEEKAKFDMEKLAKEKEEAVARLNIYELKAQATKMINEKGVDVELLDVLDFSKETAESVKDKVDNLTKIFNKAVEKKVNERLKQPNPRQIAPQGVNEVKSYLDSKYKDNPYYKR